MWSTEFSKLTVRGATSQREYNAGPAEASLEVTAPLCMDVSYSDNSKEKRSEYCQQCLDTA